MMFWYGDGMGGWGYVLMTVAMVLFWALVVVGLVMLVRAMSPGPQPGPPPAPGPTPEDILATRFAHGEIDEDEFRRRLEALHSHRPGPPTTKR
ncbi:SHOCT domain-containing protein [Rhodococcus zopfii]|uniref:SHOCT domain-containing protein n=1 Tax=Rhodococcus zopfii TaxID=43772 RepID=UPI000932C4F1|nr:SHOCT domain-containing protein [Rhodococcus zopfii]